jgi:two-component system response regulator PilR (NtrC family)
VTINCGGIPENLLESEFFGHRKGSFTGASADKAGLLMEIAHKGTLFLDEIAELSLPMQVKLLRAVQERVFRPVGGTKDISVDIRIISATNKKLEDEVIRRQFS